MDLPEHARVIFKCPGCGGDIRERTTRPAPFKIELVLEHDSAEPACRWFMESLAAERRRIFEKLIQQATSLLPEGGL